MGAARQAHSVPQVIGLPHNVVNAAALSRDALLDGIRSGRNWIAESADVLVDFHVTSGGKSATVGDRLNVAADGSVMVTAKIAGAPSGSGTEMGTNLPLGPMAALTNPIFLGNS